MNVVAAPGETFTGSEGSPVPPRTGLCPRFIVLISWIGGWLVLSRILSSIVERDHEPGHEKQIEKSKMPKEADKTWNWRKWGSIGRSQHGGCARFVAFVSPFWGGLFLAFGAKAFKGT
jgi:hypothetical protein